MGFDRFDSGWSRDYQAKLVVQAVWTIRKSAAGDKMDRNSRCLDLLDMKEA